MLNNPLLFWGFFICCLCSFETSISQVHPDTNIPTHQIGIRHDNDFFLLSDKYYSSGLYLTYSTILRKGIFNDNGEQLDFTLQQEVFTPSQTQSSNSSNFDSPYAGFSGITTTWSKSQNDNLLQVSFLLGIAGLNSGAGGLQRWYHKTINILDSPLWLAELSDSFHMNIYTSYVKEWKIADAPIGLQFAFKPNAALGTRDIYLEPEGIFYFGRRNELGSSIAYNRLGSSDREIYIALRFSYRQILYNGLLEGNLLGDNSTFTTTSNNGIFRFGLDFNNRHKRNDYKLGIRFNTSESPRAASHAYLILAYGLSF